ncbi:MAG: M23 family metallopeptidase [Caldilineaceae bacterium]
MRYFKILIGFVFLVGVCLNLNLWSRVQSQALPADIFSMSLGYNNGLEYGPRINVQNGITNENTSYGVQNPGLGNRITCFDIEWSQLYHAGVDLYRSDGTSTMGDEVTAVANGEVVFADFVNYPGNVVIIKHDDPFDDPNNPKYIYSVYSHLDTPLNVTDGQIVTRGQVIGTVLAQVVNGIDDSHLHFEIRYFEDGGNIYTNYPNCNGTTGKAGKGYTYPEHPDDFPTPGMGYTDPLAFIRSRSGQFLPLIGRAPTPTVTHTPTITPTPTQTPTPTVTPTLTPTPTPICVAGQDLVQNGDFEDPTRWNLWVADTPGLIDPYVTVPDEYALVMGYENSVAQTVYQTIHIPPGVRAVDIKFQLYIRTLEVLPIDFDYLYVDVVGNTGVTGASVLHTPFPPFTNRSPSEQWTQQVFHVADAAQLHAPIRLQFHATTNWLLATAFTIDNIQLITGCQ